jgi:predicted RNase H-like HicB family nuclease
MSDYIAAALARVTFEGLSDGTIYAEIPEIRGVWANADTDGEARKELAEVVEEWVLLRISRGLPIPDLGGVSVRAPASS